MWLGGKHGSAGLTVELLEVFSNLNNPIILFHACTSHTPSLWAVSTCSSHAPSKSSWSCKRGEYIPLEERQRLDEIFLGHLAASPLSQDMHLMPPKITFWGWRTDLRDPQIKGTSQVVIIISILPVTLVKHLPVGRGNRKKLFCKSIFPCHSCPATFCGTYDFKSIMKKGIIFSKINFRVLEGCHLCQHLVLSGRSLLPYLRKSKHHWQQFEYFISQYSSLSGKLLSLTFTAWAVGNKVVMFPAQPSCVCSEWRSVVGRCYSCSGSTNLENIRQTKELYVLSIIKKSFFTFLQFVFILVFHIREIHFLSDFLESKLHFRVYYLKWDTI